MKILVLNGPNMNILGKRETNVYGEQTLIDLEKFMSEKGKPVGVEAKIFQSNHEGVLIDQIHAAMGEYDGIIFNAGAYTHTSVALRDAIAGANIPCVEVHMTNIFAREEFRHVSMIAPVCVGSISGFGFGSYYYAMLALVDRMQ